MNYYGEEKTLNIKPINTEYPGINSPNELYVLLCQCWCKETCAPRMAKDWSQDNITKGQCSITSFLVQDIFGGDVYGLPLGDGNYHCYNVVDDICFDLTAKQFKQPLAYLKENKQERVTHFSKPEKYQRYLLLKDKLHQICG